MMTKNYFCDKCDIFKFFKFNVVILNEVKDTPPFAQNKFKPKVFYIVVKTVDAFCFHLHSFCFIFAQRFF